jgi:signal transduction histidine kinase
VTLAAVVLVAIVNLILGIAVIIRGNTHPKMSWPYAASTLFMALWSAAIYQADNASSLDASLVAVETSYFCAFMTMLSVFLFVCALTNTFSTIKSVITIGILGTAVGSFAYTNLVTVSVARAEHGVNEISGVLREFYIGVIAVLALGAVALLLKSLREKKISRKIKNQRRLVLVGIAFSFSFAFIVGGILPLLTGSYAAAAIAPLGMVAMAIAMAIAIIRHGLFDFRRFLARALAYIGALTSVLTIYSLIIFGLTTLFIHGGGLSPLQNGLYVAVTIIVAVTFQPLKRFFDKVTDGIFYRNRYQPQAVLNAISDSTTNRISLDGLAKSTLKVISNALKPHFIGILLVDENPTHIGHLFATNLAKDQAGMAMDILSHYHQDITITDEVEITNPSYGKKLRLLKIGVAIRLETSKQFIGFLILGDRQNGELYMRQDVELLKVIAGEVSLAIQNALRLDEIEQFNETLQSKVDEATVELRQTNKKLHALDEAKDEFMSMASHQLRTPLTSVKGYLSMVLEGDLGKITDDQRKVLEEAYTSSQRMVYLIGDFLNVSRIQTGRFELEYSPTNLSEVLKSEVDQLRSMAQSRRQTIEYTPPANFPTLNLDQNKFRQVMMNFIDNAIYYSPSDAPITISLTHDTHDAIFKVTDHGIGVPASERHRLFTKFYRASNAKKQRPDGTGIGLFMAQKVVVAHGGSVIFESKENEGSTFGFRLPLKPVDLKDNSK